MPTGTSLLPSGHSQLDRGTVTTLDNYVPPAPANLEPAGGHSSLQPAAIRVSHQVLQRGYGKRRSSVTTHAKCTRSQSDVLHKFPDDTLAGVATQRGTCRPEKFRRSTRLTRRQCSKQYQALLNSVGLCRAARVTGVAVHEVRKMHGMGVHVRSQTVAHGVQGAACRPTKDVLLAVQRLS